MIFYGYIYGDLSTKIYMAFLHFYHATYKSVAPLLKFLLYIYFRKSLSRDYTCTLSKPLLKSVLSYLALHRLYVRLRKYSTYFGITISRTLLIHSFDLKIGIISMSNFSKPQKKNEICNFY